MNLSLQELVHIGNLWLDVLVSTEKVKSEWQLRVELKDNKIVYSGSKNLSSSFIESIFEEHMLTYIHFQQLTHQDGPRHVLKKVEK